LTPEEFEECAAINHYDDFMNRALEVDGLETKDYQSFMPQIFQVIPARREKDPVVMYEAVIDELRNRWTASSRLPFHGPWHHGMTAGMIIAALRNNGYDFDDGDIREALKRGLMVPAGACGFLGACGAAAGLGVAVSIVLRSTPFRNDVRSRALAAGAEAIRRVGRAGGPRCCARSTYATLSLAAGELKKLGYEIPQAPLAGRCVKHSLNAQCHGPICPYFPKS